MAQHIWQNTEQLYVQNLDDKGLIASTQYFSIEPAYGYKITTLQNTSGYSGEEPTIKISVGDEGWNKAFETWKAGKPPTDSKEWKKGVFALTTLQQRDAHWYFVYVDNKICSGLFSVYSGAKKDQLLRQKLYPDAKFKIAKILKSKFSESIKSHGIVFGSGEYPTKPEEYLDKIKKERPETFERLKEKYSQKKIRCHKPDPPTAQQVAAERAVEDLKKKQARGKTLWESFCDWLSNKFERPPQPPKHYGRRSYYSGGYNEGDNELGCIFSCCGLFCLLLLFLIFMSIMGATM